MAGVVLAYLAISVAYSLRLKHVPLIELACVGSGFTLRAIGGGTAAHVLISPWFLVMTSFGALLIVAGKRTSEQPCSARNKLPTGSPLRPTQPASCAACG